MKGLGLKICTITIILCLTVSLFASIGADAQEVSTDGLEGYWNFDEGSGTTITDQSGKGRNLTVEGNSKWTEGLKGKAFDFDGSTVLLMDGKKQIKAYNLTISMYVKIKEFPKSDTGANILVVNEGVSALGQGSVDFGFFDGKMYSYVTGIQWDKGDRVSGAADFSGMKESWHHVAVVYNQDYNEEIGKSFIYIDGKLDGSTELAMTVGSDLILGFPKTASYPKYNACIGGYRDDSGNVTRSIIGAIDELMIFSRALSDAEIAQLSGTAQPDSKNEPSNQPSEDTLKTSSEATATAKENSSASTPDSSDAAKESAQENTENNTAVTGTEQQNTDESSTESNNDSNNQSEGAADENINTSNALTSDEQSEAVNSDVQKDTEKLDENPSNEDIESRNTTLVVAAAIAVVLATASVAYLLLRKKAQKNMRKTV